MDGEDGIYGKRPRAPRTVEGAFTGGAGRAAVVTIDRRSGAVAGPARWLVAAVVLCLGCLATPLHAGDGSLAGDGTLNLTVNLRFPPTPEAIDGITDAIRRANLILCDATDGEVRMGEVRLTAGAIDEQYADVWVSPMVGRARAAVRIVGGEVEPGLGVEGDHVTLFRGARGGWSGATLAHELGHYVFALGEQYDSQGRDCPASGRHCGIGIGFEETGSAALDPAHNSIMQSGDFRCSRTLSSRPCNFDSDCPGELRCQEWGRIIVDPDARDGQDSRIEVAIVAGAYSELSVPANHDLLRGEAPGCPEDDPEACPEIGGETCELDCAARWCDATGRFETTHQSVVNHGESDWETIHRHYPFLEMPDGLPDPLPPAQDDCPMVEPDPDFEAVDQVVLALDRSGSMAFPVDAEIVEVCGNETDDDGDGMEDEKECAMSRLAFAKAAGRGFVDLVADRGISLALVQFDDTAELLRDFEVVTAQSAPRFAAALDELVPGERTAIGDGIDRAREAFLAEMLSVDGRSQTVFLLSDGRSNAGAPPEEAAAALKDELGAAGGSGRIFTVPVGEGADAELMARLAADPARMIEVPTGAELPAVYAELAAIYRGGALVLPRTPGVVRRGFVPPGLRTGRAGEAPPSLLEYRIEVEAGARALTVFLSGTNDDLATWDLDFRLTSPAGSVIDEDSPGVVLDPFYRFLRLPEPVAGAWVLEVFAGPQTTVDQEFIALASVDNPAPDCFVDVLPRVATPTEPVAILARALYVTGLEGDVTIGGTVRRPDGTAVPVELERDPEGGAWTLFEEFAGRGVYEVNLACRVGPGALPARGEIVFEGPERPDLAVEPFERHVTTSFFLATADFPPCEVPDCDGDGLDNDVDRCDRDRDGDGVPDCRDPDSDDDEIPDGVDETPFGDDFPDCNRNRIDDTEEIASGRSADVNGNGRPDGCETGRVVWALDGVAGGGQVEIVVEGFAATCAVTVPTLAGESAGMVAAKLAAALRADACLGPQGITATSRGGLLVLTGVELDFRDVSETVSDPGLAHRRPLTSIPTLSGAMLGLLASLLALLALRRAAGLGR